MSPAAPPSRQSQPSLCVSSRTDSSPGRVSRRAVLATVGTVLSSALAGCNAIGSDTEAEPFHDGNWHSYANGPPNTNRVDGGAPGADEHETLVAGHWPYAPPVVHEGIVYFAVDREVVAVTTDGSEQWSRRLDSEVSAAPALDPERGRLYVPTRIVRTVDGPDPAPASVAVLSLEDGTVVDTHQVGTRRTYGVTVSGGEVYARSATACVRLAPDGTERWRRSLAPLIYEEYNLGDSTVTQIPPAVTDDGVYVPDRDALVKLDPGSGEQRWRVTVDTPHAASVVDERGVVQTGWQETVAVDHAGEDRWRRDLHSRAAAAVADGDIYLAAGDLHELDAGSGETNWQAHLPSDGTAAPVVTEESVLVASSGVRAFRRDAGEGLFAPDRERWDNSSVHATAYSSPVVAAGRVFVAGPMGLLALRPGEDG